MIDCLEFTTLQHPAAICKLHSQPLKNEVNGEVDNKPQSQLHVVVLNRPWSDLLNNCSGTDIINPVRSQDT